MFRIVGLPVKPFSHLFGASDEQLASLGVRRCVVDSTPGYPDRIELREAEVGERVLLLNFEHQPARNAYRASHAIFVLEGASATYDRIDEVPAPLRSRPLSLRAFDRAHMMVDAALVDGAEVEEAIEQMLRNPQIEYIQAHYAKRGCYAARIERAA